MADMERPDTRRLRWVMQCCEGFTGVTKNRYDYAMELAAMSGRDEPNEMDELNGFRLLIDAAMAAERPTMADRSPATRAIICAIRAAIDAEYARSHAPPSTDDFAAAVLRALADHQTPAWDGGPLCHWTPTPHTRQELRNIAAELEGRHA